MSSPPKRRATAPHARIGRNRELLFPLALHRHHYRRVVQQAPFEPLRLSAADQPPARRAASAGRTLRFPGCRFPGESDHVRAVKPLFACKPRLRTVLERQPPFPGPLQKAGYTTCHLDNQAAGNDYDYHDLGLKALFNARSTPLLFTVHNENRHPYDLELLDDYDRLTSRDDTPELVVFHLMGQHVSYSDRYPKEEAYFTPGDIRREDLTQQERQVVADYDNATRYNDQVVDAILARFTDRDAIAVYLSDHGEEVYDYRDFFCRSHDLPLTPEVCKYQFEIPFMIWMSDTYRRNRPDVAAQVAGALDRPFSADDLSHLLLDLAGIRCRWYDPARSLIGERFDTTRPRPLLMGFEPAGNYETIIGRDRKQ